MRTTRQRASELLESLLEQGVTESMILEFILNNHFSGAEALDALLAAKEDLFTDDIDDEDLKNFEEEE